MTTAFVSGAELMAITLGMRNYKFAVIDHPIASATDDQLETARGFGPRLAQLKERSFTTKAHALDALARNGGAA